MPNGGNTSNSSLNFALLAAVAGLGYLNWHIWSSPQEISPLAVGVAAGNSVTAIMPDEKSLLPPQRALGEFQQTKARPLFFANRRPIDRNSPKVAAAMATPAKIDPLFPINNVYHASAGKPCDTGLTTVSIDGEGNVRRCHFVPEVLGNIYESELESMLRPRLCSKLSCGSHIGYVHMPSAELKGVFGANILERIPIQYQRRPRG